MARAMAGFVDNAAQQIGLGAAKDAQLDFQFGLHLLYRAVTATGHQQNFGVQSLGNFGVQFGGVRFAAVGYQPFNEHHIAVAAGNGMQGHGIFQYPVEQAVTDALLHQIQVHGVGRLQMQQGAYQMGRALAGGIAGRYRFNKTNFQTLRVKRPD